MPQVEAATDIEELVRLVASAGGLRRVVERDFSDVTDPIEAKSWFYSLDLAERDVTVYWIASREGMQIGLNDFIQHYDDLWYPSSDDVWVTNEKQEWLLELNHEEVFALYRK